MKNLLAAILLLGATFVLGAKPAVSPNGKLSVRTADSKLVVSYEKQTVLEMADVPFKKLKYVRRVKDDYRMLEGKRLHCTNQAKEYQAPIGPGARIVMRVYDDGIAFRHEYKGLKDSKVPAEQTAYVIPEGTKR